MNIRYVSQETDWTKAMQEVVRAKIAEPLKATLATDDFDLCVHLSLERKRAHARQPEYVLWAVVQTFDGRNNEVVRRHGDNFLNLVFDVSNCLRLRVRKQDTASWKRLAFVNPFQVSPLTRSA